MLRDGELCVSILKVRTNENVRTEMKKERMQVILLTTKGIKVQSRLKRHAVSSLEAIKCKQK